MAEEYFKNEHLFIGNLGHFSVALTFGASILALICFYLSSKDTDEKITWYKIGRWAFWIQAIAIIGIVSSLFYIISNHYFEYYYAQRHSSKTLPSEYIISSFWEGQEGSFLLWMFWHMILGLVVLFRLNKWTSTVMVFVCLAQVVLSSMLLGIDFELFKFGSSPFELLRLHEPMYMDPNLPVYQMRGIAPSDYLKLIKDGNGLNPLLQNYWMVIHPPTLFLGFASTIIPFAYAMSGLWKKQYKEWILPALPWTLFSAAVLGTGIVMGAMWAYESLSFGGFWAWDPVENASLVPWLTLIAGLHVMVIAKNTGHSLKEGFILITVTFILILYSTFLTRSGILQNTSVHAFTDDGLSKQLFVFLMVFVVLNIWLLIRNWRKIPTIKEEQQMWSREFWMFVGALILVLSALQIIFTTSIPVFNKLITFFHLDGIFNSKMAPPDVKIYNKIQLPIAIVIAFLTALTQFFKYKNTHLKDIFRMILIHLIISAFLTAGASYLMEINYIWYVVMMFTGIYAIVGNTSYIINVLKGKLKVSGASVSHIGFGLMLIGILVSSSNKSVISQNNFMMPSDTLNKEAAENMLLPKNKPVTIGKYQATYKGDSNVGVNHYLRVDYEKINPETKQVEEKFTLYPNAQVNPKMGLVSNPDTRHYLTEDIYTHITSFSGLDPQEKTESWVNHDTVLFKIEESQTLANNSELTLKRVNPDKENPLSFELHFELQNLQGKSEIIYPVTITENRFLTEPKSDKAQSIQLNLLNIKTDSKDNKNLNVLMDVSFKNEMSDYIIMKAIRFPFINFLWAGTVIMVLGFVMAMLKRFRDHKRIGLVR